MHLHARDVVRALQWPFRLKAVLIFEEPHDYFVAIQVRVFVFAAAYWAYVLY